MGLHLPPENGRGDRRTTAPECGTELHPGFGPAKALLAGPPKASPALQKASPPFGPGSVTALAKFLEGTQTPDYSEMVPTTFKLPSLASLNTPPSAEEG